MGSLSVAAASQAAGSSSAGFDVIAPHSKARRPYLRVFKYATRAFRSRGGMMPPQCGMLAIGGLPMTLPERITATILASVLNSLRKSWPESDGIVLSGDCGFGTPPSPLGP